MNNRLVIPEADIIIVGAGISGATLAQCYASIGKKVCVIEKRDHIGGNCFDYVNRYGIRVSKYGAHLFHTNHKDVWRYLQQFSSWYPYEHRVRAKVYGKLVPIPVNIDTVNILLRVGIKSESEMKIWLNKNRIEINNPKNGEEASLAAVGPYLYEAMFKNYTYKQWAKYPKEIDASVLKRIPVRTNYDDRYFTDKYQALPINGYTRLFEKMLSHKNIRVLLKVDYFNVKDILAPYEKLFYTGPIDRYFENDSVTTDKLEYRSIRFVSQTLRKEKYQDYAVVNYPNEYKYTRIVEYKHITKQKSPFTTIVKEYTTDIGEPYYPVPNPKNSSIYEKYKKMAEKLINVYFVGRLANYKYFNMDQAFKNALDIFQQLEPYAKREF